MKRPPKLTRKKAMVKAQDRIAEIGLKCYKKGMDDAMDIIRTSFQELEGSGMKSITMEEAIVLVAQVRSLSDAAALTPATPEVPAG